MAVLYTYDDPRLKYDEVCFYYDGGYDLICINNLAVKKIYGRSHNSIIEEKRKKQEEILNVFINTSLQEVNGVKVEEFLTEKKYRLTSDKEVEQLYIEDFNITIDLTKPKFNLELINCDEKNKNKEYDIIINEIDNSNLKDEIKILISFMK